MARLIFTADDFPAIELRSEPRRRVLLLMSRKGTAIQEALIPIAELRDAGVDVVIGSDQSGPIEFDGPCNLLAAIERFWSPAHRLRREAGDQGWRAHAVDAADPSWVDRFDAVLVAGGHGRHFAAFIKSAFVQDVIRRFIGGDRLVALQCHSVVAAALPGRGGETPIGFGRQVTCWPGIYERILSAVPFVGRHFLPLGLPAQDIVSPVTGRVHVRVDPRRMPHVVIDGPLLTSWGPWSAGLMSRALAAMIETRARDARPFDWEARHVA